MRDYASRDVPPAQFGSLEPRLSAAVEDLGFGQVALLQPTKPLDECDYSTLCAALN